MLARWTSALASAWSLADSATSSTASLRSSMASLVATCQSDSGGEGEEEDCRFHMGAGLANEAGESNL